MSLFLLFEDSSSQSSLLPEQTSIINGSINIDEDGYNYKLSTDPTKPTEQLFERVPLKLNFMHKILWKIVLFIMALFFFAATYVQHNDPDPYLWMPVYLIPMIVNLTIFVCFPIPLIRVERGKGKISSSPKKVVDIWKFINYTITVHSGYCYILGFWTLAHFIHRQVWAENVEHQILISSLVSEPDMHLEEAKELLGLCLVIAWMSFLNKGNFLRFGKIGIIFGFLLAATPIIAWVLVENVADESDHSECSKF